MQLWKHQRDALEKSKQVRNLALLWEMGTGKTLSALSIVADKARMAGRSFKTLILCPPVVISNWKNEADRSGFLPSWQVVSLFGSGKKRVDSLLKHIGQYPHMTFITNYEALLMEPLFTYLQQWQPEILIADEVHKCKDMKTKRTKKLIKLADNATFKYILTGTPVLNSPMDLFAQFRILDNGQTFGKNFYSFRYTYFYDKNSGMNKFNYFPDWRIKPGALEQINEKVHAVSLRITKSACLDLPPMVNEVINVEMCTQQARLYNEMKDDFITYLNGKAVVAELAITKALRLQQIVSGFVKDESGRESNIDGNNRLNALHDLLSDLTPNHKVIVWAVFKNNYKQIKGVCEKLKIEYVEVHGEISQAQKDEAIRKFNNEEKYRVYIGHPGSGGIGVNLVVSPYSIFYTRNFSLEQSLQAESRNHRGGSEIHSKITRIDIVTPGTIDEIVMESLHKKESVSEKILRQVEFQ